MKLSFRPLQLPLEFEFTISRSSQTMAHTILVEVTAPYQGSEISGIGEAVPCPFYGETVDSVCGYYEQLRQTGLLDNGDPMNRQALHHALDSGPTGHWAARAALDAACWDWAGRALGVPVYSLLGLDPHQTLKTSYTLGIADLPTFRRKLQTALDRGYEVLKLKLGGPEDRDCLMLLRQLAPTASLRIDANAAWTLTEALDWLPILADAGVTLVEEPLRLDSRPKDYEQLYEISPLPLVADESCHRLGDIPGCVGRFHGVNLKLTKTGGLTEALAMLFAAKAQGLQVMLGCFTESSLAITTMAHLSPLADYADLDGHLLVGAADPFDGVQVVGSQLVLPQRPGLGVRLR